MNYNFFRNMTCIASQSSWKPLVSDMDMRSRFPCQNVMSVHHATEGQGRLALTGTSVGARKTATHSLTSGAAGWEWPDSTEEGLISISLGHGWWCSLAGQSPHCHDNELHWYQCAESGLATSWKQTFNESSTDSLTKISYLLWIVLK